MAFAQLTEFDLAMPISALALRLLALLRIRCWSPDGIKPRELGLAELREGIGDGGSGRGRGAQGREAVAAALAELVQLGLVQAIPRPGNGWRLAPTGADPHAVPDEDLPARFRRKGTPGQKSAMPTSRNRESRSQKSAMPTSRNRESRSQKSAMPIAEVGYADRRNRESRLLTDDVDQVDRLKLPVDGCVDGSAPPPPSDDLDAPRWSGRRGIAELRQRHQEFLKRLPPGPRRLRVVWLVGTPSELALGFERERQWVAEVLFEGELEPAQGVLFAVFEHAWQQAYDGKLDERWLARTFWGQGFRARVREWADAQPCSSATGREDDASERALGPDLTSEQMGELAARALENLRRGKTG